MSGSFPNALTKLVAVMTPFPQKLCDKAHLGQFMDMRDLLMDSLAVRDIRWPVLSNGIAWGAEASPAGGDNVVILDVLLCGICGDEGD